MRPVILFFLIVLFLAVGYYFFNESYRLSLEAKAYYELGDYKKAEMLAKKAYKKDKYNKMAFSILTQSNIARVWVNYIDESNKYLLEIEQISNKKVITQKDKSRIKIMLEIIINEFKTLPQSKLLDEEIRKKAEHNYNEAVKLFNEIFNENRIKK